MHVERLSWAYLGRVDYRRALALQQQVRDAVAEGRRPDTLLLLEHPPVVTLGRSAPVEHVLLSEDELKRRGVLLARVARGGEVTYHGPGQLVGYPVRRVGRRIRAHVAGMVEALRGYLGTLGIRCWWEESSPGLWTPQGKIAAVGVDARGGTTTHGFALNLAPELSHFALIVPCGSTKPVTSVACVRDEPAPSLPVAAEAIARRLAEAYGMTAEATTIDLDA